MGSSGFTVIITSIPSELESIHCDGHEFTRFGCLVEPQSTGRGMPPVASDVVASALRRLRLLVPGHHPCLHWAWGSGVHAFCDPSIAGGLTLPIFFTNTPPLVSLS